MGGRDCPPSPTSSSTFLPLAKQLRRASVSSIASLFDKQTLNQTLDQIHQSASQSDKLTTFNDYAPPPASSSSDNRQYKRPSSPVGIGSWYSRVTGLAHGKRTNQGNVAIGISSQLATAEKSKSPDEQASTKSGSSSAARGEPKADSEPKSSNSRGSLSRPPELSKTRDVESTSSVKDKVTVHNPPAPPLKNSSHRHALSNSSRTSLASSQELRKDSRSGREILKRSMTPDPVTPGSGQFGDGLPSVKKAASISLAKTPSRTASVSSNASTRRSREEGRPSTKHPHHLLGAELGPRLSKISSRADSLSINESLDSSAFTEIKEEEPKETVTRDPQKTTKPAAKVVSRDDAVAALRRFQVQRLDSSGSSVSAQTKSMGTTLVQLRNKVLSRQYWMKDENARDCFYCGDSFSTFRRKHHCRTCGQIFDAKCTTIVSGANFGQSGTVRVCKPCEGVINAVDDSSDYTDDDTSSIMTGGLRRRHNSRENGDVSPSRPSTPVTPGGKYSDLTHYAARNNLNTFKAHMPSALSRRMIDDLKRSSGQFEDDSDKRSVRPMSSRSFKSVHGMRPHTAGHRRHHSKHLLQRSSRNLNEANAPFYQRPEGSQTSGEKLPAFHSDNVIDPDLAAYLSDEADSDEEEQSLAAALAGSNRLMYSGEQSLSASTLLRRPASRYGDKALSARKSEVDFDNVSMTSSKPGNPSMGHLRRRNVSFGSNAILGSPPKPQKLSVAAHQWSSPSLDGLAIVNMDSTNEKGLMVRSTSLQGSGMPSVELNNASLQHGKRLLRQLLEESSVEDVNLWENALMPILLRATDDVMPNVQAGDAINITNYVKLKKVSGGRPGDTAYVSGVVFSKSLALKSMPRRIKRPNIMILTFAIEYSRHQQHFMSLEPVIRQEHEYLQNIVNRIAVLRPQLLLVQRNVSGIALELLNKANISTAHNVKRSVLEAISRCCQTKIITSMDKLASLTGSHSMCESFYLKSFVQESQRKTYMYLSGCPQQLGCTIVLRGAGTPTLRRIKRVTEFMLQAFYNLRLETSLVRDEFALIPHYGPEGTIRYEAHTIPSFQVGPKSSTESTMGESIESSELYVGDEASSKALREDGDEQSHGDLTNESTEKGIRPKDLPDDIPAPSFYSDLVEKQRTRIISTSPFVKFMPPYLLKRARESEMRLTHLKRLLDQDAHDLALAKPMEPDKFSLIPPEMINEKVEEAPKEVREILQAVHESEYDKAAHIYQTQAKQWESSVVGNSDMFNPLSHQSITVLHSLISTSTNIACSGPDVFTIRFYDDETADVNTEADCTIGQYVEDTCLSADAVCAINGCEKRLYEHRRQYVHGEGMFEVTIERSPPKAPGLEDVPLMWSTCRKCGKETQTVPMSQNTWNYSFGKYLELAFWSIPLRPRADICPHDLHRDHWRYFGYQNWALRFQYDPINLLEVIVPRTTITWKVVNDLKFKNDNFRKAERRLNKFVNSVRERLKSIRFDTLASDKAEECKQEIERLLQLITEDHEAIHKKLQEKYVMSKFYEIVPLNRALRMLHEKAGEWDEVFQDIELNFFPSEKDIRRLATLQLKKMFLDRDEVGVPLASPTDTANTSFTEDMMGSEITSEVITGSIASSRILSPEKAHDVMASVIEDNVKTSQSSTGANSVEIIPEEVEFDKFGTQEKDPISPVVNHLDLAVSPTASPRFPLSPTASQIMSIPGSPNPKKEDQISQNEERVETTESRQSSSGVTSPAPIDTDLSEAVRKKFKTSGIPRFTDFARRRSKIDTTATLQRSQSQPGNGRSILRALGSQNATPQRSPTAANFEIANGDIKSGAKSQRKQSQRFTFAGMKEKGQSFIPRSISTKRNTRVSVLTKHFEQLSKEFERQRIKDQQQRALRHRQAGAYPAAALKPIVEIYRNVAEAVGDSDGEQAKQDDKGLTEAKQPRPTLTAQATATNLITHTGGDGFHEEDSKVDHPELRKVEDVLGDFIEEQLDKTDPLTEETQETEEASDEATESHETQENAANEPAEESVADDEREEHDTDVDGFDIEVELPKHEKTSLMKMLTNFWAERSSSGWEALYYPLRDVDHVFANSDIIVREDEPSSLIALALDHSDYQTHIRNIEDQSVNNSTRSERQYVDDMFLTAEEQRTIERSLLQDTGHHLSYQFERGAAKMQCKIFWAEQFQAVRKKCGVSERIVESLSRCLKWDSKGGKTKSVFLKTLDDRFVLKSLSPVETRSFLRFAPFYFNLMGQALFHELPSLIAKMLGFYQVTIRNPVTGTDFDWYLLLMENLFYDRAPNHIFDLKGSMRNRRITPSGEQNEVLLDENMVDFIAEHPIFAREHSKKLLRSSIYNDTLFLYKRNVMDYSLMLGIDDHDGHAELVVGIIDCIRTYTWDKKLESWVKDRGKNRPTVTEPKDYKNRFREAINRYVMEAPTCWHFPATAGPMGRGLPRTDTSLTERDEDGIGLQGELGGDDAT